MNRTSKGYRTAVAIEHRVFGIAFLALLVFFGWLTYAIFNKTFTEYVPVTLQASKTGLQLPDHADVKLHGVIVGEVIDRDVTAEGATLTLGLYPRAVDTVPADVTARIIPKTLFGEKYVALQTDDVRTAEPIERGDVIEEADVAIEVERVLNDIYPLLRTVQPADLNYTLTAMATALEGRGEDIGENFAILDDYLKRTNPQIPELVEDLRLLSDVSDVYREVVPEVARTLRNSVTTGNTFVEQERKIEALFDDVASFASTSRDFLEANGDNIIRLGELSQAQLPLYAQYSPEYPCLLQGQANWLPQASNNWRGHMLHINLEILPSQPRGYTVADDPVFGADNGPHCETLPTPPYSQDNPGPQPPVTAIEDGVETPLGKRRAAPMTDLSSGFAGTAAEQSVVDAIAAPVMGVSPDDVPDVATLLFGPLARGIEVNVR